MRIIPKICRFHRKLAMMIAITAGLRWFLWEGLVAHVFACNWGCYGWWWGGFNDGRLTLEHISMVLVYLLFKGEREGKEISRGLVLGFDGLGARLGLSKWMRGTCWSTGPGSPCFFVFLFIHSINPNAFVIINYLWIIFHF